MDLQMKVKYSIVEGDPARHCEALDGLIRELAEYEQMPDGPELGPDQLKEDLTKGAFRAFLAVLTEDYEDFTKDTAVGYIVYYYAYSTWQGKYLFVEDIYVKAKVRLSGIGDALWTAALTVAYENKFSKVEWNVLAWNEPAIRFYNRMGSVNLYETEKRVRFRLERASIEKAVENARN